MDLIINRNSDVPLYKQIVEQITLLIKCGVLKNGDRLPTERALAQKYRLSLGTVKAAYAALALSCLAEPTQGRGTFVNNSGLPAGPSGGLKQAADIISAYLDRMSALSVSLEEIEALMLATLKARHDKPAAANIAVVNRCPEFLEDSVALVSALPGASVAGFTASQAGAARSRLINSFDLIIATPSVAEELKAAIPVLEDKIVGISYSFDNASLARLAAVEPGARLAIFTQTGRGAEIIRAHLRELDPALAEARLILAAEALCLREALSDLDGLIIPNSYAAFATPEQIDDLARFQKASGGLIGVGFKIDAGSTLYIGSEVAKVSMRKAERLK